MKTAFGNNNTLLKSATVRDKPIPVIIMKRAATRMIVLVESIMISFSGAISQILWIGKRLR